MILGVSFDTPEENRAFRDKEGFTYPLLSDVDRAVGTAYGTLRAPDDPFPDWPRRITFLIDPTGVIRRVYEVKDAGGNPAEVLADITAASTP